MRLKNVKGAVQGIENSQYVIKNPEENRGKWRELFGNENPLHIEIGTGKGKFITELAQANPNINYVGIEKFSSVLIRAIQKQDELELGNLFFIRMDAEDIEGVFDKDEVARIYLNFSDPWPKDRHSKRRLTSRRFMARYNNILAGDGVVEFKTDNRPLFDFSLEEIPAAGWELLKVTYDLHNSEMNEGNIMTEYEMKFSALGNPICKLIASR